MGLDKGAHSSDLLDDYGTLVGVDGSLARLSEEHGILRIPVDSRIAIGDRIRIDYSGKVKGDTMTLKMKAGAKEPLDITAKRSR